MRDVSDSILGLADRRIFFTVKNRLGRPFKGRGKIQQLKLQKLQGIFNNAFLDREQPVISKNL